MVAVPAPDADAALQTMVRLAEALGPDWQQLNAALLKDRGLRGRLFGVIGSSLALGDHLVANPRSWHLLEGTVTLPDPRRCAAYSTTASPNSARPQRLSCRGCAITTATSC